MLNPRRVLTRAQLLEHVWDYDFNGDARVLETYVSYLRKKLDAHGPAAHPHRARRGLRAAPAASMMASLRARLLAAVLALTACGLLLAGGITYVEQRSFQYYRVDQQLSAAIVPVAARLEQMAGRAPDGHGGPGDPARGPAAVPTSACPAGTYGEKRDASGRVLADKVFARRRQRVTAKPDLPAKLTTGDAHHRRRAEGRWTRAIACSPCATRGTRHDHRGASRCAPPTRRCSGCSWSRRSSSPASWSSSALVSWVVVRVGLLPLDRMGHTAGAIAGGDLSHRVESTDPRTEVGRLGIALNAMLDRLERRLRRARGQRGPPAALHRRRLARAAHAAGLDPRLRRAVPHGRGARAGRRREGDAAHRGRGRAHGRARRGPADPRAPRRGARRAARARLDLAALVARRRRRRARGRAGPRDRPAERRSAPWSSATATSCARCSATCCATRSSTRPRGRRSR